MAERARATLFSNLYARFEKLQRDPQLNQARRELFACAWADSHSSVQDLEGWSAMLDGLRPDYALAAAWLPLLFLELKRLGESITSHEGWCWSAVVGGTLSPTQHH